MPELPEVETTLRGISPYIERQTVTKVIVRQPQLRWAVPKNIQSLLQNKKIISTARRGKYLLLNFDHGSVIIHLGMSGHLRVLDNAVQAKKHDHIDVHFKNKKILRYTDPRRFGAFLWADEATSHVLLKTLGVEPLTEDFSGNYLYRQAQHSAMPIKAFLMENKIVTGVGNIYATEALFSAAIHPMAPAKSIPLKKMNQLVKVIKKILQSAIQRGGTSLKDFLNSDGKPGYFSNQLMVYGRAGLSCMRCENILQTMRIRQRSTVYCSRCQK